MRRLTYPKVSRLLARSFGLSEPELESCFRPATEADLEALVELRGGHKKIGHRERDFDYLTWRYQFSGSDWKTRLWAFELHGRILGTVGVERDILTFKGAEYEVCKLMDILVHEDHMLSGLGVWINLRLQEFYKNTFCIGSTRYSHSIVTKLNRPLPSWQTWRYPIRIQRLRGRKFGVGTLNALLRVRGMLQPKSLPKGFALEIADTPAPDMAELSASMSNQCLMPSRSVEKWDWRFKQHPTLKARFFQLSHRGRLEAQAVVSVAPTRRAELYDLLARHEAKDKQASARALSILVSLIIHTLRAEGADVVSTRVNDPVSAAALSRAGFVYRDEQGPMGYHFGDEALTDSIVQGVPIFLMPADADYD